MKAKVRSKRSSSKSGSGKGNATVTSAVLFGSCTGLLSALILSLVCTFFCLFSSNPDKLISPLCIISLIIIYFLSGFASAKKRAAAVPCGLLSGGCVAVMLWIISLCFNDSYSSGLSLPVSMLIRLSFICVSLVGALLAVNTKARKRKRRR